jgi:transposase
MTRQDLAHLSSDELIELVLEQQAEIDALRLKLEKNKKPPTHSGNSSQPPSRDQKGNLSPKRKRHPHGPPHGHVKYAREFVAHPDHVVEVKPKVCQRCQADVSQARMVLLDVNQVTELPVAKAEVIEVRQYATECPCCGEGQTAEPPASLDMQRAFGARLEATVVYYRQEQHMSYTRTRAAMRDLHGVEISEGGIDKIMQRMSTKALEAVKPIEQAIRESAVIHSDETSSRVNGNTFWQWVFGSVSAVLHIIRFNRSFDVIKDLMGEQEAEVWVCDCYNAQMKAPSKQHQLCLAHQLRNLQAVVELLPKHFWARHVQRLFRYAIHLHNQRKNLPDEVFSNRIVRIEKCFDRLLNQNLDPPEARRLQRRYQKYRDAIFPFLYRMDVSPTNNVSERRLRPAVIHRKVSGGFRSEWGAKTYAALKSLTDTGALLGLSPFEVIQKLAGIPALPLGV